MDKYIGYDLYSKKTVPFALIMMNVIRHGSYMNGTIIRQAATLPVFFINYLAFFVILRVLRGEIF